jgi:hypothetical protein
VLEVHNTSAAGCRSSFPDFRHQHNSWDALWLEDAPQRAAEAVARLDADADRTGKVSVVCPRSPRLHAYAQFCSLWQADPPTSCCSAYFALSRVPRTARHTLTCVTCVFG